MSFASPEASSESPRRRRRRGFRTRAERLASIADWTVLVLAAAAPLAGVWLFGGVRLWSVGPLSMAVLLAALIMWFRIGLSREPVALRLPPGAIPFAVFTVYGFALVPWSAVPYDAFVESLRIATYLVAGFIWLHLLSRQNRVNWLITLLFIVVGAMAWYSLILHAHGSRAVLNLERPDVYYMRASGAYFCPNHFANLLAMTIPFALGIAVGRGFPIPLRLLAAYTALLALPPLYLTQSRSGWIGIVVAIAVFVLLLAWRRSVKVFVGALAAIPAAVAAGGAAAWALSPMVRARIEDALQGNVRLSLWKDTLAMIADSPVFGFGPYSYRWVYPHYWHHMKLYFDPQFAHNDYLHLVAEYGAAGLLLIVAVVATIAWRFLKPFRRMETGRAAPLVAGLAGAAAGAMAHACFDFNFHIYGNVQVLVLMIGLTASVLYSEGVLPTRMVGPPRLRWSLAAAALSIVLLGLTGRAVASYAYALQGDFRREAIDYEASEAAYQRALRIDDGNWSAHQGLGQLLVLQAFWNRDPGTKSNQIAMAMASLETASKLNTWSTDALFGISRLHNMKGDREQALAVLGQMVEKQPHHWDFRAEYALQLRMMGRYAEALEAFRAARPPEGSEKVDLNIDFLTRKLAAEPK